MLTATPQRAPVRGRRHPFLDDLGGRQFLAGKECRMAPERPSRCRRPLCKRSRERGRWVRWLHTIRIAAARRVNVAPRDRPLPRAPPHPRPPPTRRPTHRAMAPDDRATTAETTAADTPSDRWLRIDTETETDLWAARRCQMRGVVGRTPTGAPGPPTPGTPRSPRLRNAAPYRCPTMQHRGGPPSSICGRRRGPRPAMHVRRHQGPRSAC